MVANMHRKKVQTHWDDEVGYIFTPIEQSYNNNMKIFCFGQVLKRKKEPGQIELDLYVCLRLNGKLSIAAV
jgi:hypothetical protein